MSKVCPESKNCPKYVWSRPTTYVCSKPGVQKQKSEVQNYCLKPKSGVSKKSKTEVQTRESEVWCPKSVWNLPKVCLKSYMWSSKSKIRSLSEVWNKKSVWTPFEVCPKSELQNLCEARSIMPKICPSLTSENRILKSKIATKIQNGWKKRIGLSKKIDQSVIIKNEKSQVPSSLKITFKVSWGMVYKKS